MVGGEAEPAERLAALAHADRCERCRGLLAAVLLPADARGDRDASSDGLEPTMPRLAGSRPPAEIGDRIDHYTVLGVLGRGSYGVVVHARDNQLGRDVALKLLHPGPGLDDRRLMREAQAMARLSHPNVVMVHGAGVTEHGVYVAMEMVDGTTLTGWVERSRHEWDEIVDMWIDAGKGLAAAHDAGLVHRDFKPDNVLVGSDGGVLVTDFGLAAAPGYRASETDRVAPEDELSQSLTQTGAIVGTPRYMSPEQHVGRTADAKSDQYSFCLALWEALSGTRAFEGAPSELAEKKATAAPSWPASAPPPKRLVDALRRGLDPDPRQRWDSMNALLEALTRPKRGHRPLWIGVAAASVVAVAVALHEPAPCDEAGNGISERWNESIAADIEQALTASGAAFADSTALAVRTTLDQYAAQWQAAARDNCEATLVEGTQSDLVMDRSGRCLERSRAHVAAAVETILAQAHGAAIERLTTVVNELPPVSRCRDSAWLAAVRPLPDTASGAEVGRLEAVLARVETQLDAGNAAAALASIDAESEALRAVDHAPLRALAEVQRGRALRGVGRLEEAIEILQQGYSSALELGDPALAVVAARRLGLLLGDAVGKAEEGLLMLDQAVALAARPSVSQRQKLATRSARAVVLPQVGRVDEGLTQLQEVYADARRTLPASDTVRTEIGMALGAALYNEGLAEQALVIHREVLDARLASIGPDHPDTGMSRLNIAASLDGLGRPKEAADELIIARRIFHDAHGERSLEVGLSDSNLSVTLRNRGQFEAALDRADAALTTFRSLVGEGHLRTAAAHHVRADALQDLERFEDAESAYWSAIASAEAASGPDNRTALRSRLRLARCRIAAGKWASTEAMTRALVATTSTKLGADHLETALAWETLGEILVELDRPAEAVPMFENVARIVASGEARPSATAVIDFKLARALGASGQEDRARALAARAREGLESAGYEADRDLLIEIDAWLQEHHDAEALQRQ